MRKTFLLLIASVTAVLLSLYWWKVSIRQVSASSETVRFVIPKGYSASQVGNLLFERKLIRSPLAFKIFVQVKGSAKKIKAGEYDIPGNLSLFGVVEVLLKGPSEVWVTIPEGLRREEIVEKFIQGLGLEGEAAQYFKASFLEESQGLEGKLFPDTYLFPKTIKAETAVLRMTSVFETKIDSLSEGVAKSDLTLVEIVTLASIIERETRGEEERPIVAGILIKRLENDWPLQVDAANQYAVATLACRGRTDCLWWPILSKEDLNINSPFNTYKFAGLPPSPIANPGLSALRAAVSPQESPYWFYLHDSQGEIHYAKTLEEHNENISRFLGK